MNTTYIIKEIDIDVKRPIVDVANTKADSKMSTPVTTRTSLCNSNSNRKKHCLIEQVTIKKTKSTGSGSSASQMISSESSTEIKTIKKTTTKIINFNKIPKILATNWDESIQCDIEKEEKNIEDPKNTSVFSQKASLENLSKNEAPCKDVTLNRVHRNNYLLGEANKKTLNIDEEEQCDANNENFYYDASNNFEDSKDNDYYFRNGEFSINDPNNNESNYPDKNNSTPAIMDKPQLFDMFHQCDAFDNDEYNNKMIKSDCTNSMHVNKNRTFKKDFNSLDLNRNQIPIHQEKIEAPKQIDFQDSGSQTLVEDKTIVEECDKSVKIAKNDIICWKLVLINNDQIFSLVKNYPYQLNELNKTTLDKRYAEISQGFHSFSSLKMAKEERSYNSDSIIIKCTIPKNSKYYENSTLIDPKLYFLLSKI